MELGDRSRFIERAVLLVCVALLCIACNKPAKVCDRLEEFGALPIIPESTKTPKEICIAVWTAARKKDAAQFEQQADCVLAAKQGDDLKRCKQPWNW